jgi:hypothetical protein
VNHILTLTSSLSEDSPESMATSICVQFEGGSPVRVGKYGTRGKCRSEFLNGLELLGAPFPVRREADILRQQAGEGGCDRSETFDEFAVIGGQSEKGTEVVLRGDAHVPNSFGFVRIRKNASGTDDVAYKAEFLYKEFAFLMVAFHSKVLKSCEDGVKVG